MLLVETYINAALNKGIGLFANIKIPKGTKYWVRNEVFDKVISPSVLDSFEKIGADYIRKFGFLENTGNWYLCGDNARYSNHSQTPNTEYEFDEKGLVKFHVASKDIEIDEEIIIDYTKLCETCRDGVDFQPFQ